MLIVCKEMGMAQVKVQFMSMVDCEDLGPMKEYIGTNIDVDMNNRHLKIVQQVLVNSLADEFTFAEPNLWPHTPVPAGTHLLTKAHIVC